LDAARRKAPSPLADSLCRRNPNFGTALRSRGLSAGCHPRRGCHTLLEDELLESQPGSYYSLIWRLSATMDKTLVNSHEYDGKYVAIKSVDDHTIIGSGKTPEEALNKAREKGIADPFLLYVPEEDLVHIYNISTSHCSESGVFSAVLF